MKRLIRALVQLGILYLAVSIVLDYFLSSYQLVLWPALAVAFAIFSILAFNALWIDVFPSGESVRRPVIRNEDDLARLQHLCSVVIEQGEPAVGGVISERVRSLAFTAAAYHLNSSEDLLRSMAERQPSLLNQKIGDELLFQALITKGTLFTKHDSRTIIESLMKIEDWTD